LLLIVAMSRLVFGIDPDLAGPQIRFAVTSMLPLIAYRFMVGGMLPRVSCLTRMDRFTTVSTILVFLTFVEVAFVVTLTRRTRSSGRRRWTGSRGGGFRAPTQLPSCGCS
jgi:hypothetical protein